VSDAVIRVRLSGTSAGGPPGGDRSYDIVCGRGVLGRVGPAVRAAGGRRAVLICDAAVNETHGERVAGSLAGSGIQALRFAVASGETTKSVDQATRLWEAMAAEAVDRETHVIAVGGGVTGDLGGFVAATFARGLPCWQVPTTLVAQVDSAIGGKTGVNLAAGKNLVGAFWQPRGVFADIETLATLPAREYLSGLAEVVKYGVIFDPGFFAWLEENSAPLRSREPASLAHAVERSAAFKAAVVEEDERETTGARAALNYGHTFAHAYEAAAGYGRLLHGEAVAIGMAASPSCSAASRRSSSNARIGSSPAWASLSPPTWLERSRLTGCWKSCDVTKSRSRAGSGSCCQTVSDASNS